MKINNIVQVQSFKRTNPKQKKKNQSLANFKADLDIGPEFYFTQKMPQSS